MSDRIQDSSSKVSARRRLIRGAFATPAVFTLCSGGALAQTSSALRCIAQANDIPTAAPAVSTSTDSWVRVQLVESTGSSTKYFVLGSRLPMDRVSSLPTALQWQEFIPTGPNANTLKQNSIDTAPDSTAYTDANYYAALRIDATGKVVDVGNTSSTLGSAIGTSCWTSFIMAA